MRRNVFAIVPRPVAPPVQAPPPVLPDIKISGFVVNGPHVRALFALVPKSPKDDLVYYDLSEGQSDGILQLSKINLDEQAADIVNSGVPMRLSLRENGFKVTVVSPPAAAAKLPGSIVVGTPASMPTPPMPPPPVLPPGFISPHN